jgi:hypothetical protein
MRAKASQDFPFSLPPAMLLILLAIISSTALLVGAISAIEGRCTGSQGIAAIVLALLMTATNFLTVRKAGLSLANSTKNRPEAVQARYGKIFSLMILLWSVCAGFFGFWAEQFVRSLP